MFDTALIIAQLVATAGITCWLTVGVHDNIKHPSQNEEYTAEVMEMRRMRDQYPDAFAPVTHRAVSDRTTQLRAFRAIVVAELLATGLLWIGTIALGLAAFGIVAAETARAFALIGAASFTMIWTGMLCVGNYFCYWFCHEGTQNTHYQMTLWGIGAMILLAM